MFTTPQHRELQRSLQNFIRSDINPFVEEWERAGITPLHELMKKMGALGLLGIDKPEAYGGMGLDYSYAMVASETLGEVDCGGVKLGIDVQTSMATPALARFGSHELKEQFLRPAVAGESVCSIAVSEVSGGSDVAAITTTARRDGDDYVISGGKVALLESRLKHGISPEYSAIGGTCVNVGKYCYLWEHTYVVCASTTTQTNKQTTAALNIQ